MNPDECAICFEAFTPDSGHSVLGCGHKFHLMCVVRWFQDQEGPSTCPCCRRESGVLDNVPLIEDEEGGDEEDDEEDGSTVDGWSDDEDGEDEDVGELRPVWTRQATGQWERTWVLTGSGVAVWDPATEDVPEEMEEGAVALQRIWRGWRVRRGPRVVDAEMLEAARILITIKNTVVPAEEDWHYRRFLQVN